MPDASVHCVCTSPPYYSLRDYGVPGQIGLESSPAEYIAKMVEVFREVRRVLRDDGTLWVNIGDSYAGSWGNYGGKNRGAGEQRIIRNGSQVHNKAYDGKDKWRPPTSGKLGLGLKAKDLCGIPWRLAFALQDDGWYLRSDIIWSKPNPMPESVTDRPTKAHEYLFLLTKSARYFYDSEAVKERSSDNPASASRRDRADFGSVGTRAIQGTEYGQSGIGMNADHKGETRNRRSVWTMATHPNPEAHFATFPEELPEICIKAGTSERGCCAKCGAPWARVVEKTTEPATSHKGSAFDKGKTGVNGNGRVQPGERFVSKPVGWQQSCKCEVPSDPLDCTVLDPFAGTSTTGVVALRLGRRFIGIELNPEYCEISERRLREAERNAIGDLFLPLQREEAQRELFAEVI